MSSLEPETKAWLNDTGFTVQDEAVWHEALTHGSTGDARDYERLEFLGDRVLGLTIADWLFERSNGAEGQLAQRLNALVSRASCAARARAIGAPDHIRLGKQARDDVAADSDNVLGDIMEALLGANFLVAGFDQTRDLIRTIWQDEVEGHTGRSKHPKSALQEWAAGNQRRSPVYEVVATEGPDHARRFTVRVSIHNVGAVEATANGKQDAQTQAARLFMEKYG